MKCLTSFTIFDRPFSHKALIMSPRTKEQFETIRSNRKYEILSSALEMFARHGYHQASISKIASNAGISKGLLYNYFNSKEDLLKAVIRHGIEGLKGSFHDITNELDTPEELMIFIKGGFNIMKQESHFYKLYFTVILQKEAYKIIRDNYKEIIGPLLNDIAYYFKAKGDPHPLEKAMVLGALLDGVGIHYLMAPDMFDLETLENIIFDLFK